MQTDQHQNYNILNSPSRTLSCFSLSGTISNSQKYANWS